MIGLLALLALATGSIYFFIPSNLLVTAVTPVLSNYTSTVEFVASDDRWQKWWPGKLEEHQGKFIGTFKDVHYEIASKSYNNTSLLLIRNNDTTKANLAIAGFYHDSIKVICQFMFQGSMNPITRVKQYNKAVYLKENIHGLINSLKSFLEKPENIYGFKVISTMVKDTVLMSTKTIFNHYPSTQEIYTMVNTLKKHISENGGIETNVPMLNVTKESDVNYKTMVAIPVNHSLPISNTIALKRMVVGRILESDSIKGGKATIDHSFKMFEKYFSDFKHTSPAIPFESLITDRVKETDTTKWITRFYYPIF